MENHPSTLTPITSKFTKWQYVLILMGILWVIGIIFIEYFFYKTKRLSNLTKEQKEKYGAYSNEPEKWRRWAFYLCNNAFFS
jgi:phosphotransferase system  glucose/maltose/N-acetylglucosamine-specific IIC component